MKGIDRPVRFLVVEDDPAHTQLIEIVIESSELDCTFEHVSDGAAALARLQREDEYTGLPLPDVVLLDLNLPKISGHEVLNAIKDDDTLSLIPVIVLTTSSAEADHRLAYELHANSVLTKPLGFPPFQKMMEELMSYWGRWNQPPWRDAS